LQNVWAQKVYKHTLKEIGWHPVEKVAENELTAKLPSRFVTFHWHGDTFDLPNNAVHLFKTSGCAQQGFLYKKNIAAIQFHFEVMENLLNGITEHERSELVSAPFVQTEEEIKAGIQKYIAYQQQYLYSFMDAFVKL